MDRIVCLIGASGSGKTTIAKELELCGYNIIHSYVTREPREENEWGHIFSTVEQYLQHKADGQVIAAQNIYSNQYWATKEQYQGKGTSIYVIDQLGYEQLKSTVKDAKLISIHIKASERIRYNRLKQRKGKEKATDRVVADRAIFAKINTDYTVNAEHSVGKTLFDILSILGKERVKYEDNTI